jgi:hypothetical protein
VSKDAKAAYALHKRRAASRGIGFTLTFDQWWALWEPHWDKRGTKSLEMCMCRKYDEGDYALGNVRIATNKENAHERTMMGRIKKTPKKFRSQRPYRTPLDKGDVSWLFGAKRKQEPNDHGLWGGDA